MTYETYLSDAEELVSAWELSDADLPLAIKQQAQLMAGLESHWCESPSSYSSHENCGIPL
jgi:hypothetical protein